MPAPSRDWTRADVLALPDDGNRYELVDGELLVSPSPRAYHQIAVGELFKLIDRYLEEHPIGRVLFSPADLDLRSEQLLQPDLFVVDGRSVRDWPDVGIPLLIAEVLSPSTARYDRMVKRRRFQKSRVPTYWIVDLDARLVEVWTPDATSPVIADAALTWQPRPELPALTIDLARFFGSILEGK